MNLPERQVLLATPTETDAEKHQTYPLAPQQAMLSLIGPEQAGLFGQAIHKHFLNIGKIVTDYLGVGFITGRVLERHIQPDKAGHHHMREGINFASKSIPGGGSLPGVPKDDPWTSFRMDERLNDLTLPEALRGNKRIPEGDEIAAVCWEEQLPEVVKRVAQAVEEVDQLETGRDILVVSAQPITVVLATLFGGDRKWDENLYRAFCQRQLGQASLIRFKRYQNGSYRLESWYPGPYFMKDAEMSDTKGSF